VLQRADGLFTGGVVMVQAVEHRRQLGATRAQHGEQQLAFLAVMQLFRKFVHVEQHGAQHFKVGQRVFAPRLGQQHVQGPEHGRQGLMLVLEDVEGGMSHGASAWQRGRCRA
jgi:hypothetical protein